MIDAVRALLLRHRAARAASEEAERENEAAEQLLYPTRWDEVTAARRELEALGPPWVDALRGLLSGGDAAVADEARRLLSVVAPTAAPLAPNSWETRLRSVSEVPHGESVDVLGPAWTELLAAERARGLDQAAALANDAARPGPVRLAAIRALRGASDPRAWDALAVAAGTAWSSRWSAPVFAPWAELVALDRGRALELAWLRADAPALRAGLDGLGPGPGEVDVFQAALQALVDARDLRVTATLEAEAARGDARGGWARARLERWRARSASGPALQASGSKLDPLARRLLGRTVSELDPAALAAARARLAARREAEAAALRALPQDPAPDGEEHLGLSTRRPSKTLPRRQVQLTPDAADLACPVCAAPRAQLAGRGGSWTAPYLDWQVGKPAVVEYVRSRHRCATCAGRVVMARLPRGPKGLEPAFVTELVVSKLVERTPLAALAARPGWADLQGLVRGLHGAAFLLEPVARAIRAALLAGGALSVARADVLVEGQPAPLWAYRGAPGELLVVCELHAPDEAPAAVLRTFAGLVQADAALDATLFEDRRRVRAGSFRTLCEGLVAATDLAPGEELTLLAAFERLLEVDERLRAATAEERRAARQAELRPLVDELLLWLDDRRAAASPGATVADRARDGDLAWRHGERGALVLLLEDGRLHLDAGPARRALDRIVCGRATSGASAWTFADTRGLARCAATLHTVVGSALDLGLDVRAYLTDALLRVRDGRPPLTPGAWS